MADSSTGGQQSRHEQADGWKDILRTVLRSGNSESREPLSVLLFLCDTLAFLRSIRELRDAGGKNSQRGTASADRSDDNGVTTQYCAYLNATYLPSSIYTTSNLPSIGPTPPFRIATQTLPSLTPLVDHQLADPEVDKILQLASIEALRWLQQLKHNDGRLIIKQRRRDMSAPAPSEQEQPLQSDAGNATNSRDTNTPAAAEVTDASTVQSALESISNDLDFSSLPAPNKLLQATLQRALAEAQASRASTPSTPMRPTLKKSSEIPVDVGIQRWALSSLLQHYLGDDFGLIKQVDGVTAYARDERDDLAIREFFRDPRRFSIVDAELSSPTTPSIESMNQNIQELSMSTVFETSKGDEKLKWLLGEFVSNQTVRRRSPLPNPTLSSTTGAVRSGMRNARMVARSPTAYHPRRRFPPSDQDWLSDAELQEVVSFRRRSSSAMSEPMSPPHKRAWSADSDLANLRRNETNSSFGSTSELARVYPRGSFETTSPSREWQSGVPLSRINSYDTYDSQSRLLQHRHRTSEAAELRTPRAQLHTVEDRSPEQSPKASHLASFTDATLGNRPFMNLYAARPSSDSVRSEPASTSTRPLPPTTNVLSAEDKQNLVRKNRKLKAMLGSGISDERPPLVDRVSGVQVQRSEERFSESLRSPISTKPRQKMHEVTAGEARSLGSVEISRSSSAPIDYSQQSNRLTRSMSVGSSSLVSFRRHSNASYQVELSQLSPIAASFVSDDGSIIGPDVIIQRPAWTEADAARDARRRKLMKIQAFLGERVPASALSNVAGIVAKPPPHSRRLPMFAKASDRLQRRLTKSKRGGLSLSDREEDSRKSNSRNLKADNSRYASLSMDERSRSNSQTSDSNAEEAGPRYPTWTASKQATPPVRGALLPEDPALGEIGKAAEPVILAVRRARKLEKVFGSLPPAQLYARTNRWVSRPDDRYAADNISLQSKASRGSIHRARIASIRFIAASEDPKLVQDFARVVLSEESDASDIENASEGLNSFDLDLAARRRLASRMKSEAPAADVGDDPEDIDGDHEELLGNQADRTIRDRGHSFESEVQSPGDVSRSSIDTSSSQPGAGSRLAKDLQARLGLFGSSPSSPPTGMDLLNQRFDRSKTRKGRDSVLSAVTAHSSAGSAYAVDGYGRPQRSQSRASHNTSAAGTPRSSMESVRLQFRRAHKLATVFGTTRGEVFNRVLDDIEADIAEADDEDMDEEEKKEIIESVTALRASL